MAFVNYNPNPNGVLVGDCVIRAISKLTGQDWDSTYIDLLLQGFVMKDMPSSNAVWGAYLTNKKYKRGVIPNTCPDCYTVEDFANEHPKGAYLLSIGTHVVTVVDGDYYDSWDSGKEIPVYYYHKKEGE